MNIYSKKYRLKLVLFIFAIVIGLGSFIFINTTLNKIANEERQKMHLWGEAIQKKAYLVEHTKMLFNDLTIEERKKVELWAKAVKELSNANENTNIDFLVDVVKNNETVPVILVDDDINFINCRNFSITDSLKFATNKTYLENELSNREKFRPPIKVNFYQNKSNYIYYKDSKIFVALKQILDELLQSFISEIVTNSVSVPVIITNEKMNYIREYGNIDSSLVYNTIKANELINNMAIQNKPIKITLGDGSINYLLYQDSSTLTQLALFPYWLFGTLTIFVLFAYWVFSSSRKAEQNQVWVGLAKETAHQLGTPTSSLLAWVEYLKTKEQVASCINDIESDVKRLQMITDRFSKIGSAPKLQNEDVVDVINESANYMKEKTSKKIHIHILNDNRKIMLNINKSLFQWVVENLFRNAIDAMKGSGDIYVSFINDNKQWYIDFQDTGKGINKQNFKTIFNPGFTTKKRGWGLGLSLSKRIIENYHHGKIFVKSSEINKGTVFRISLSQS